MQSDLLLCVTAGDESDSSQDEWDLGGLRRGPQSAALAAAVAPEQEQVWKLKKAISGGDAGLLGQLLDTGVDVDYRLSFGWTLLMCAVHNAHYEVAKLLLDRGASANFSKDQYTVLMIACMASASEARIAKCVELLLSWKADPNIHNRSRMTPLMVAAREGYCQVINLLVSCGAELNAQDSSGYTALAIAVQCGQTEAVLKLLQLGAHKNIRTKAGQSLLDLAKVYQQAEIGQILVSHRDVAGNGDEIPGEESPLFLKGNSEPLTVIKESSVKLGDIDVFLCGLNLEHLSETMLENDITWGDLSAMEQEDLEQIGIMDPDDQRKILSSFKEVHVDQMEVDMFMKLENIDSCEELHSFLVSLRQHCCYLTDMVQDVMRKFPKQRSEIVLSLDPRKECQAVCSDLVILTGDLHKEVVCLRSLFDQLEPGEEPHWLPTPAPPSIWRRLALQGGVGLAIGMGLMLLLSHVGTRKIFV